MGMETLDRINLFEERLNELEMKIKFLDNKILKQDKMIKKLKKQVNPTTEKKTKPPSGFAKPTYISPKLCTFLQIEEGSEIPRTEVTKRVINYIKENDLQDKVNKKVITMDNSLKTLLNPSENEEVTYFTIQKLLKVHYQKPIEPEPSKVETVVENVEKETVQKPK